MSVLARIVERLEPIPIPSSLHPGGIDGAGRFAPGTRYTRQLVADVIRRQADPLACKHGDETLEYPRETVRRDAAWKRMCEEAGYTLDATDTGSQFSHVTSALAGVTRTRLEYLYNEKRLTLSQIGALLGISGTTVSKILHSYGIQTRGSTRRKSS